MGSRHGSTSSSSVAQRFPVRLFLSSIHELRLLTYCHVSRLTSRITALRLRWVNRAIDASLDVLSDELIFAILSYSDIQCKLQVLSILSNTNEHLNGRLQPTIFAKHDGQCSELRLRTISRLTG